MIPGQNEFLQMIGDTARKEARTAVSASLGIEFAKVVSIINNKAVIQFDGEDSSSQKTWPMFTSCVPAVGDRVMLIRGIIIGGWRI